MAKFNQNDDLNLTTDKNKSKSGADIEVRLKDLREKIDKHKSYINELKNGK